MFAVMDKTEFQVRYLTHTALVFQDRNFALQLLAYPSVPSESPNDSNIPMTLIRIWQQLPLKQYPCFLKLSSSKTSQHQQLHVAQSQPHSKAVSGPSLQGRGNHFCSLRQAEVLHYVLPLFFLFRVKILQYLGFILCYTCRGEYRTIKRHPKLDFFLYQQRFLYFRYVLLRLLLR